MAHAMTVRSNGKAQLAFGLAILIMLAVGLFSYRAMTASEQSARLVQHTEEVLGNLHELRFAVQRLESTMRGFVLTGQDSYLVAYNSSVRSAKQHLAAIRRLTANNPMQKERMPTLEGSIADKIAFSDRTIGLRRIGDIEGASAAIGEGRGRKAMDRFESVTEEIGSAEQRLLVQRTTDTRGKVGQTKLILIFGTLLGIAIALAAAWSVQRGSARRRMAEASLRDSEEKTKASGAKYRGLLEAAPDAMVVVNQTGEIVLLNMQAEKQFGYRRDELLGQKMTNVIPDGFAERLIADGLRSTEDALAQQIGMGIELTGQRKDGSTFPIEIMLSPLESAEGTLVTAAIRDISVRKTAEQVLFQKVEELKRSNVELGQFAYIASHDLQEPLRMVASYTQLLSRRYKGRLDADADEFIAFAMDGASRMQRLIQDLLTYSRVGTKARDLLDTSSEEALEHALINLRGAVKDGDAVVTHDPLPHVRADAMQLTQLFQNLVGNAIKYQAGNDAPHIHISAALNSGKKWEFSVKDNGLGIEAQYFEKIFGMFQRLHKRDEYEGTGIGLAICRKIVERHGGVISVESEPGLGSTFRFDLSGPQGTGATP